MKKETIKKSRGNTFVGFAPKTEPTKKEKLEKQRKKHKKRLDIEE